MFMKSKFIRQFLVLILTAASLFAGGPSYLAPPSSADTVSEQILLNASDAHAFYIHVKTKFPNEPDSWEIYQSMMQVSRDLFQNIEKRRLLTIIRRISNNRRLLWQDIAPEVFISYHSKGSHKYVFKIVFKQRNQEEIEFLVAAKMEKTKKDIMIQEISSLKKLQRKAPVPRFGDSFSSDDGHFWFVEEFIEGETAGELRDANKLTLQLRKNIVTTLMAVAVGLNGYVPRDIHGGNFIKRKNTDEMVIVDVGNKRLNIFGEHRHVRHQILFTSILLVQYGYYENSRPEDNYFIFNEFISNSTMPGSTGFDILKETADEIKKLGSERVARIFYEESANLFWQIPFTKDNLQPLNEFAEFYINTLTSFLAHAEMRLGPPGQYSVARAIQAYRASQQPPPAAGNDYGEKPPVQKEKPVNNTGRMVMRFLPRASSGGLNPVEGISGASAASAQMQKEHLLWLAKQKSVDTSK